MADESCVWLNTSWGNESNIFGTLKKDGRWIHMNQKMEK